MEDMCREMLCQKRGRPQELYLDASTKDVHAFPDLTILSCDCGRSAHLSQSRHPNTLLERESASDLN